MFIQQADLLRGMDRDFIKGFLDIAVKAVHRGQRKRPGGAVSAVWIGLQHEKKASNIDYCPLVLPTSLPAPFDMRRPHGRSGGSCRWGRGSTWGGSRPCLSLVPREPALVRLIVANPIQTACVVLLSPAVVFIDPPDPARRCLSRLSRPFRFSSGILLLWSTIGHSGCL